MRLTGLTIEQYKAFPRREEIELRPLTVLIGKNSAGKSAIARLPLLIARAVSGRAEAPLDLDVEGVDFGSSFTDLLYNRRRHGALSLGLRGQLDDGKPLQIFAKVQHFSERMLQVVTSCEVTVGEIKLELTWTGNEPQDGDEPYSVAITSYGERRLHKFDRPVSFVGLLPDRRDIAALMGDSDEHRIHVVPALQELDALLDSVGYLGPFRAPPQRSYRLPGGNPRHVGRSGVSAPALLGADAVRRRSDLLKSVSAWFAEHLGGWRLDVERQGDQFALVLIKPGDSSVQVNLVDAGTGLSQVLPLVVQRQLDVAAGASSALEVIEQPELHLHPAAHAPLADLYVDAIRNGGMRFLIETHAENFLLRIRRRIAEGVIPAEQVALYWVDDSQGKGSTVRHIEITPSGDVSTWPRGVFSEDVEEVKGLRLAQSRRGRPTP